MQEQKRQWKPTKVTKQRQHNDVIVCTHIHWKERKKGKKGKWEKWKNEQKTKPNRVV